MALKDNFCTKPDPACSILYNEIIIDYLFNFIKPQSNHCIYTRKMSKRGQQERLNRSCICLNRNQRSRKNSVFEEQNLIHLQQEFKINYISNSPNSFFIFRIWSSAYCFNVTGTAPCEYITNICSGIQYPLTYFLQPRFNSKSSVKMDTTRKVNDNLTEACENRKSLAYCNQTYFYIMKSNSIQREKILG